MATAASRQRAHLFREMNKSRASSSSSRHSQSPQPTITSFNTESEAEMSTREIDNLAQKLPKLRASAEKYRRPMPARSESEYYIDTSAMVRAFPDFTQGSIPDNDSISIEIGRGAKTGVDDAATKNEQPKEDPRFQDFVIDESLSFAGVESSSSLYIGGPGLNMPSGLDDANTIQKPSRQVSDVQRAPTPRNQAEPSPPTKANDHGSAGSRQSSDGSRRTLTAMHARVRDENDMSIISDQRPPPVELTVRKTRFGNGRLTQNVISNGLPATFSTNQGLESPTPAGRPLTATAMTPTATQHPVLADAPNMSELISGVFEDGAPVFSRNARPRAFQHATNGGKDGADPHANVDDVPVPFDEQAIYLSLKLLEDKVAVLERGKAEAEVAVRELQEQNLRMQIEKSGRRRTSHRSDSALGTTDSEAGVEVTGGGRRKAVIERNRLEFSVRTLQAQLDVSTRKASTAERILESITQERDSAVSQLSVAYVTTEHLKIENEAVKAENCQLKDRINELTTHRDNETQQWKAKETILQKQLERRLETVKALEDEKQALASRSQAETASNAKILSQPQASATNSAKTQYADDYDSLFDLTPRQPKTTVANPKEGGLCPSPNSRIDPKGSGHETSKQTIQGNLAVEKAPKNHEDNSQTGSAFQDTTFLSFFDTSEIAKLRRTIEEERAAQKQRIIARHQSTAKANTAVQEPQSQTQMTNTSLPQETPVNDLRDRSTRSTQQPHLVVVDDDDDNDKKGNKINRRHSEPSTASTRSRRRARNTENMTSAFILPDITIRTPAANTQELPVLTNENKKVLNDLSQHGTKSCTVCKRAIKLGEHHEHAKIAKSTIMIPKPVPVSERLPESVLEDEDHTLRPSQPPGLALASVLKGLEDETAHLKIKLSKYQALYNGHDPSLSRRQRKAVYQKTEGLLQAIDAKSDQIYALYDVLEGQKQQGQDLTEQEVEVTLQSIGMDISEFDLKNVEVKRVDSATANDHHSRGLTGEANEVDEPWDGVESTVETTKSDFSRASKRRSSTT